MRWKLVANIIHTPLGVPHSSTLTRKTVNQLDTDPMPAPTALGDNLGTGVSADSIPDDNDSGSQDRKPPAKRPRN